MTDVVVIGGGFAGMAAACRLAAAGLRPLVLETRPAPRRAGRLLLLPEHDEPIDHGEHVLMRCCTASTGFLARIGASHTVRFQENLSIPVVHRDGRSLLRSVPLPGILHLAPSLLRYRAMPLSDRLRAMAAGLDLALGRIAEETLFADWLRARRQSDRAIDALWNPICIAALNAPAASVSARAARQVFRDAFFRPGEAEIGLFTAPLSEVAGAAHRYIEANGGDVRPSAPARRLLVEEGRIRGVELRTGEAIDAQAVIGAVQPLELARLLDGIDALAPLIDAAGRIRWSPIVNLHVWLDRPVLDDPFTIATDSPVQAVFDVTRLQRLPQGTTHLVLSQSAADAWIDRPDAELADALLNALGELFPRVRSAVCLRTLVVRHRRATLLPEPGVDRLRPRAPTPVEGLYLAGDWTSTGWPSTIEGAIRSGIVAAAHVESHLEEERTEARR